MALALVERLPDDRERTLFKVIRLDGAIEWTAEDAIHPGALDFRFAVPLLWSQDGESLYFSHQVRGDGCLSGEHSDLYRINLQTGEITSILPDIGDWLALSPDEQTLAYITLPDRLVVRNLASGAEQEIRLDIEDELQHDYPGTRLYESDVVWSPTGDAFALSVEIDACGKYLLQALIHVNASTLSQTTLITSTPETFGRFTMLGWPTAAQILLRDQKRERWWLDVRTSTLVAADE